MTKQGLLTKLATECATWKAAYFESIAYATKANDHHLAFSKQDWLSERERLLNKPDWAGAPEEATHLAVDEDGGWFFYSERPVQRESAGRWFFTLCKQWCRRKRCCYAREVIEFPAGYDWRDSLEERPV